MGSDLSREIGVAEHVVVNTRALAIERAQALLAKCAVPGSLISEELIAERREEARLEDEG